MQNKNVMPTAEFFFLFVQINVGVNIKSQIVDSNNIINNQSANLG